MPILPFLFSSTLSGICSTMPASTQDIVRLESFFTFTTSLPIHQSY